MSSHPKAASSRILILDFGAQYSQLIARRVREAHVYCELHPADVDIAAIRAFAPTGIILSGGPSSVLDAGCARHGPWRLRARGPDPRHLLWAPAHRAAPRRPRRVRRGSRVRARVAQARVRRSALRGPVAGRRAHRLDESRRPGARAAGGHAADRDFRGLPLRGGSFRRHSRLFTRKGSDLGRSIPSRGRPHRRRSPDPRELRAPHLRLSAHLDDVLLRRRHGRGDPAAGGKRAGRLRPFRGRRLFRRGGSRPPRNRRPADLHLRRPRHDEKERARRSRGALPRGARRAPRVHRRVGALFIGIGRNHGSREEAQDHRQSVHRGLRGRGSEDRRRGIPRAGDALSRT